MTNKAQQDLLNQLNEYRQTQQLDEIPGKFGQAMKQVTRDLGGVAYDSIEGDGYNWKQGVRSHSDPINPIKADNWEKDAARVKELLAKLKEQKSKMFNMRSLNEALSPDETKELAGLLSKHVAKSQDPKYAKLFSAGNAYLQKASGEAQRKAGLEKKLGTTGAQATAANAAKTAVNKSIARNQRNVANKGGIKTGINQATKVPGQKGYIEPTTQMMPTGVLGPDGKMTTRPPVDKNKDGKDDQSGKPIAPAGKRPTISGIKPEDPRYPALYKAYMNNMNKTV
jgi:hypothetical protein